MPDMLPVVRKYFGDHTPARTTVQVSQLAHPHLLVEVDAIAIVGEEETIIDGQE
jgi:enamine deaminase RidA (YjgF/YER057c/UK114 family)